MLNTLKKRIRTWLGIDSEMEDVWLCIRQLQDESAPKEHQGGAVEAKGRVDYEPNQSGNVVVVEPKILSVERGKRG